VYSILSTEVKKIKNMNFQRISFQIEFDDFSNTLQAQNQ